MIIHPQESRRQNTTQNRAFSGEDKNIFFNLWSLQPLNVNLYLPKEPLFCVKEFTVSIIEAAKKFPPLVVRPLRGRGGGEGTKKEKGNKALVGGPLVEELFLQLRL